MGPDVAPDVDPDVDPETYQARAAKVRRDT